MALIALHWPEVPLATGTADWRKNKEEIGGCWEEAKEEERGRRRGEPGGSLGSLVGKHTGML